nr:hypothetical protein L204_05477 [Cryptococcus depauperatus CBS 7855]
MSRHIPSYICHVLPHGAVQIQPPADVPAATSAKPSVDTPHLPMPPSSRHRSKSATSALNISLPSISTNVPDFFFSSLLPPNLPKLPMAATAGKQAGAPRELTTQREGLSVPILSNNFRRFVTRVGPVFWIQDRVEEVLFWRKPVWTWGWMLAWSFICFKPRVLLMLPSLALIIILLHVHERSHALPSLLGKYTSPPLATARVAPTSKKAESGLERDSYTATTTKDEKGDTVSVPAVPPKEVESGVDYYMNIQAIQNMMGLVSDLYDQLAPRLAILRSPSITSSPFTLPLQHTHYVMLLLLPTLLLPLTPAAFIPYLLLPFGILPPLLFHPNLTPLIVSLPSQSIVREARLTAEKWLLTDQLPDQFSGRKIAQVYVFENERLDPKVASSPPSTTSIPPSSWSSRFLRQGDRPAWVKVSASDSIWKVTDELETNTADDEAKVLGLKDGWAWVPGEDWRVDLGDWSEVGLDDEGWLYTDDSWQNPSSTPYTEPEDINASIGSSQAQNQGNDMPNLGLRRITRRRKWWKRVYQLDSQ